MQIQVYKCPGEVTSQVTSAQSYLFTKLLESPLDISCPFSAAIDKILHFLIFLVIFVLSVNLQIIGKNNSLSLRAWCICIKGAVFFFRCALSLASSSKLHQSCCHQRMLLKPLSRDDREIVMSVMSMVFLKWGTRPRIN